MAVVSDRESYRLLAFVMMCCGLVRLPYLHEYMIDVAIQYLQ